jgi:hypothetical protein
MGIEIKGSIVFSGDQGKPEIRTDTKTFAQLRDEAVKQQESHVQRQEAKQFLSEVETNNLISHGTSNTVFFKDSKYLLDMLKE